MTFQKIGIFGIGAIGSVISFLLKNNPHLELHFFNRSQKDSVKIYYKDSNFEFQFFCKTIVEKSDNLDWLIICLKEYQYEEARKWLKLLIGTNTKVVVIRNGLRLEESLSGIAQNEQILECIIDCPTQPIQNDFYKMYSEPVLTLVESAMSVEFSNLFIDDYSTLNLAKDFKTICWKKLCESSALGSILCLTGETCWIFHDEKMRDLYRNVLNEAVEVAKSDGAIIEYDFVNIMLEKLMKYPSDKGSSMLTDRLNGNPIEIGAKNGIISKIGKEYGISTPLNDIICGLLSKTNNTKMK